MADGRFSGVTPPSAHHVSRRFVPDVDGGVFHVKSSARRVLCTGTVSTNLPRHDLDGRTAYLFQTSTIGFHLALRPSPCVPVPQQVGECERLRVDGYRVDEGEYWS